MKGIILAGGTGSRLYPLTKVTNKHLLPVGQVPLIFHPRAKLIVAGGIAQALALAENFCHGDSMCVILGDNIFEDSLAGPIEAYKRQGGGARILLKEVEDPTRFGVAEIAGDKIVGIEEKPAEPKSSLAVCGIYFFDATVFDIIRTLEPSGRGELEISDVNNAYVHDGKMGYDFLSGWWTDAGTFESLKLAQEIVGSEQGRLLK